MSSETESNSNNSSLFRFLSEEHKQGLIRLGQPLEFSDPKCLFQKGDDGNCFYIIRKGTVTITVMSDSGEEIILNKLTSGEAFGEIAILDHGLRTADAFVAKGTSLISIKREIFFGFLNENPSLYPAVLELLCSRLRWCSSLLEDLLFFDCHRRLISKLVTLSVKYDTLKNSVIEISQVDLAKMLGTSREVVNRNLQQLQENGLLSVERKKIIIPDVLKLKKIIGE